MVNDICKFTNENTSDPYIKTQNPFL